MILDCVCGDESTAVYIGQNSLNYMLKIGIYKLSFQRVDLFLKVVISITVFIFEVSVF